MSFFTELKRRNVFRVGAAYLVVAWLLLQIVDTLGPILSLPVAFGRGVFLVLLIGFPLALIVSWVFELTPVGLQTQEDADQSGHHTTSSRLNLVVIVGMALVIVLLVLDNYILDDSFIQEDQDVADTAIDDDNGFPAEEEIIQTSGVQTLAVLPFDNLSADGEQEYFADGISEELISVLTRLDGLQVAGRTSSFYFKDRDEDLATAGEMLGVEYILEGSVRKAGDQVRINAQLVNSRTGFNLWTETYDRGLDDIFAIQDEIAKAVATALSITLGVGDLGQQPGMTSDLDAYDIYLQILSIKSNDVGPMIRRGELARQALAIDPDFGLAWLYLALGESWEFRAENPGSTFEEMLEVVREPFEKARALAPQHYSIRSFNAAMLSRQEGRFDEEERIQRELYAQYGTEAVLGLGVFLLEVGKPVEAIRYFEEVRRHDPLSVDVSQGLIIAYNIAGRTEEAFAEYERASALSETHLYRLTGAAALVAMGGDDTELIARLNNLAMDNQEQPLGRNVNPFMLELLDDRTAALTTLHQFFEEGRDMEMIQYWSGYFDDPELSLQVFRRMSSPVMAWLPFHDETRQHEGFKELLQELGMVDYFRSNGWNDFCQPLPGGDDFECN